MSKAKGISRFPNGKISHQMSRNKLNESSIWVKVIEIIDFSVKFFLASITTPSCDAMRHREVNSYKNIFLLLTVLTQNIIAKLSVQTRVDRAARHRCLYHSQFCLKISDDRVGRTDFEFSAALKCLKPIPSVQ